MGWNPTHTHVSYLAFFFQLGFLLGFFLLLLLLEQLLLAFFFLLFLLINRTWYMVRATWVVSGFSRDCRQKLGETAKTADTR